MTAQKNRNKQNKERKRSFFNGYLTFMLSRMNGSTAKEKASLYTLGRRVKKAGLTLEAAVVVPVFLFGMISMFSFMDIYRTETVQLMKICSQVKEEGLEAYGAGGGQEVTASANTVFRPPALLLPLPAVSLSGTVTAHAWTGAGPGEGLTGSAGAGRQEEMVYMTQSGQVFHRDLNCTYIRLSIHQAEGGSVDGLRNRYGERYHACELCSFGQQPAAVVYVTDTGSRYHNLGSCSGLRRTVRLVPESEAGCRACSRCGH